MARPGVGDARDEMHRLFLVFMSSLCRETPSAAGTSVHMPHRWMRILLSEAPAADFSFRNSEVMSILRSWWDAISSSSHGRAKT